MVSTIRKRASPAIIFSYADGRVGERRRSRSAGRTPVRALKARVSSESCEVPEAWPATDVLAADQRAGGTGIGSIEAPRTTRRPPGARPPTVAAIASAFVTVARTTSAPPSVCSSAATSRGVLSM